MLTLIVIRVETGIKIGRKDRLFGLIGTISMDLISLLTIGPPAERAYAVEPVGVATRSPSPEYPVSSF
jgi:hypothetical protein